MNTFDLFVRKSVVQYLELILGLPYGLTEAFGSGVIQSRLHLV